MRTVYLASMTAASLMVACGGAPPPTNEMADATASIRAAEELNAPETPQGALHLSFAKKQVKQAKALMGEDDNQEALMVLQRARVDAEVAIAHAKLREDRAEASEVLEDIDQLEARAEY